MRPHDLPSAEDLGRNKPHGHKMKYMAGCRCRRCRRGNSRYEAKMALDRQIYGPNDLVPTDRVRAHLKTLQKAGMGHKTVGRLANYGKTGLAEILWYGKSKIRRRAEARILAVRPTIDNLPRKAAVPAKDTVARIRQMILWGVPKSLIGNHGLGQAFALQVPALKGATKNVYAKTACRIRDFFSALVAARALWERRRGPIPAGSYVYFKRRPMPEPRMKDIELRQIPVTFAVNFYSPDLREVIRLKNKLKREIRAKRRK